MSGKLEQDLANRTWPAEVTGRIMGDYDKSPYVRQGRVFSRALRMHQNISEPIAPGESGVTGLCRGANGMIYGATSGKRSHLFYYDPSPLGDSVVQIGVLDGVAAARRTIAAGKDRIFVAASQMIDPNESGPIFVHDIEQDHSDEFRATCGPLRRMIIPVEGECVAAMVCDADAQLLYGVSSKTGTLFSYDCEEDELKTYGPVSKDGVFSHCLVIDGSGTVYGTHSLGTLYRKEPFMSSMEDLEIRIPTVAGREFYNQLDSAVYDPVSGLIFGGGTADGILFSFDPKSFEIRNLGKVIAEPRVRAIAAAPDGRIFGVAGDTDGMGHLFCHDPQRHETVDLGIMFPTSEVWRRGFEFDAACTGENGEIYFGENEWEGHLFLYFPRPREAHQKPKRREERGFSSDEVPF